MRAICKGLAAVLLAVMLLALGGCGDDSAGGSEQAASSGGKQDKAAKQSPSTAGSDNKPAAEKCQVTIYYPDDNAEKLIPVTITVAADNKYTEAVERLISGKPPKGAVVIFPKATKVKSVKIADKIAAVDFSAELVKNFSGGSAGEIMLVNSLADTLTEFDGIEAVRISVEGRSIDTLSGHLDLSQPIKRNAALIKK